MEAAKGASRINRINDRVLVGVIGGTAGYVAKHVVNTVLRRGNLMDFDSEDRAAGLFIRPRRHPEPAARALGRTADAVISALFGVGIAYMLSATGGDRATFKGAMAGAAYWATIAGGLTSMGVTRNQSTDPKSALGSFVAHLAYGSVAAAVIERIGASEIFNGGLPIIQVGQTNPQ